MAQARWRAAARIVASRWADFLRSEADMRAFAFASYLAALDAEETAATRMARVLARTTRYRTAG